MPIRDLRRAASRRVGGGAAVLAAAALVPLTALPVSAQAAAFPVTAASPIAAAPIAANPIAGPVATPLVAAPRAPVTPLGPLAPGPRSALGGDYLTRTGIVKLAAPGTTLPALPAVSATSWLVADLESGQVLGARDAHGRYAPASTLKTLTAVALIPRIPPGTMVTPAFEDVAVDGSKVGLVEELRYPARELFTALLVVSGNDAAGALATAVGGMPAASALLNEEAARLQALDTKAVNTSGLDAPGQLSSAYDLALIARAGMAMPEFRDYVAVRRSSVSAPGGKRFEIYNHNKLLGSYDGALGIKNGYTSAARSSFVGAATRDGRTLVVTMMRSGSGPHREAAQLLDWGFATARAGYTPVGQLVDPVPVPEQELTPAPARVAELTSEPAGLGPLQGQDDDLPVLPALLLIAGVGSAVVLVRQHRQQTQVEQRRAALSRRR